MKKNYKTYFVGILAVVMLLCGTVTAASNLKTLKNVQVGGITIVVNGKQITMKDANGKTVEPMIYEGTTYLPVRAVAEALEQAVSWDGNTKTVYVGSMEGKLEEPTVQFKDLTNISDAHLWFEKGTDIFDNYGGFYSNYFYLSHGGGWYDYWNKGAAFEALLNGKYSTFKATLFVEEGTTRSGASWVRFIGDDKVLFTTEEMVKTSEPINVEVDIRGVKNFKIMCMNSGSNSPLIFFANEGFYQ